MKLALPDSRINSQDTTAKEKILGYLIGPSGCLIVNAVLDITGAKSGHTHFGRSLKETCSDRSVPVREFVCSEGGRLKGEEHCTEQVENYFGIVADEYAPRIHIQQKDGPQHTKAVMIRTKEYKYIMRLYEEDEFYDLSKGERINEIDNPDYKDVIDSLRSKLLRWYLETCDTVPFEGDRRMPDDFFLENINAFLHFRISPLIKGVMKLTRNDFTSLASKAMKLLKIDTNKFYKH